ncbi:MAG: ATP-dependent helicase/nuclease subunit A [Candidatus Dichloromethanomonas elyunquensis]|nr:MAG: ATP-dependent helicase/nuclease subunit A [Candidatus Dichloromethanomonas elyunquensis]
MAAVNWTKEQWEVITAKDCNLLVAAAAGSGKTAVLVQRIIRIITEQESQVDIDRLLVVTFTNAAAAEMRERIAEAMTEVLGTMPDNGRIQRQLTLLNKASITTIHSFCLEVIRSNFQRTELDPNFRIADETEALLLKNEVLQELFEEIYDQETEDKGFLDLLESYGGNRNDQILQDMVMSLYTFTRSCPWPEQWLKEAAGSFKAGQGNDFSTTPWGKILLESVRDELEGLKKNLLKAVDIIYAAKGLDKYLPVFLEEAAFLTQMVNLCSGTSGTLWDDLHGNFYGLEFKRLPAAAKDAEPIKQQMVKNLRDTVKKRLSKIKERIFCANSSEIEDDLRFLYPLMQRLADLVIVFGKKYTGRKQEKAIADFNDLEHFCLEILTDNDEAGGIRPSEAAWGYRERFKEILVDEYQDSNLVQEMILEMISKVQTATPNIFMVGDVKQSIYRFRQAKPELFLEKYNSYSINPGSAFRKILLFKNFRSRKEIVEAVNYLFQQTMSVSVGELDYTEEEALNPGANFPDDPPQDQVTGGAVELLLIQTGKSEASLQSQPGAGEEASETDDSDDLEDEEILDSIQCEARVVARRIQELMRKDEEGRAYAVYDKNRQEYRHLAYKDIVVLLRTTKNWADVFKDELASAGIPAFADTGTGFFHTPEIQVILSLLQIIDNPLQDIPLLAVLRSPLVSFTTDELAELRLAKRKAPLYEALKVLAQQSGDDARQTSQKAAVFLQKLYHWQKMSLYLATNQLLWQLYTETGYYGIVGAMPAGEQRQANLRILFERARQYEETSFKGLFNFIHFINRLKSNRGDLGSAKILSENDNVVRIMSIHKSKGLEFPVVILSGCGKKFNLQDMNKSVLFHQELGLGPDVTDFKSRVAYPSLPKQAIREKIKKETLSEEMRILYVALTRAREKLIISGSVTDISGAVSKWARDSGTEDNRLPAYEILQGERYLDWIGPAVIKHPGASVLREVSESEQSIWDIRIWYKNDIVCSPAIDERNKDGFLKWLEGLAGQRQESDGQQEINGEEIRNRLSWQYSYAGLEKVPAKISVTELKKRFEEEQPFGEYSFNMKKPLFLSEKKGLSPAEAGTAMHFVMQHLDFQNGDIEKQIESFIAQDLLTTQQAESVNLNKIRGFTDSLLGRRMVASGRIEREVPFNLEIPCREAIQGLNNEHGAEKILLQGVIDCYFEETDGLVLIDYKTDAAPENGSEEIKEKYRTQIFYYGRALQKLTGKRVKEKFIYLFSNGEIIRCE